MYKLCCPLLFCHGLGLIAASMVLAVGYCVSLTFYFIQVASHCKDCSVKFGRYFCEICRLFDDHERGQFHCHGCGICRCGENNEQLLKSLHTHLHRCGATGLKLDYCLFAHIIIDFIWSLLVGTNKQSRC